MVPREFMELLQGLRLIPCPCEGCARLRSCREVRDFLCNLMRPHEVVEDCDCFCNLTDAILGCEGLPLHP